MRPKWRAATRRGCLAWRGELVAAVLVVAGMAAFGAALSLVWWWCAPTATLLTDPRGALFTDEQPEQFIASDSRFGLIASIAGIVAGLVVWFLRRWRGPVLLVALALGALLGSWLMRELGEELGQVMGRDALAGVGLGEHIDIAIVDLHATGLLFAQPLFAVMAYVMCASWSASPDLRIKSAKRGGARVPAGETPEVSFHHSPTNASSGPPREQ